MASTSLAVTVSHAIAYITRPLLLRSSSETILKLQLALEANLTTYYAPSWVPSEPLRGSGRRCITLSPASSPPRPIFAACHAANVDWCDWIAALGGHEFDLFVDPGCVSIRFSHWGAGPFSKLVTVWSEELAQLNKRPQHLVDSAIPLSPAFVERLREDDEEDEEELFAMLADELAEPTWKTPVYPQFSCTTARPAAFSRHSRSSSISSESDSSSGYSLFDDDSSVSSASSVATEISKLSRRERARLARVYIDENKKEVTNYDGGKTTVLTGGVMLGAPPKRKPAAKVATPVKLAAPPKLAAAPWSRQPYGPSPNCTWRIRA